MIKKNIFGTTGYSKAMKIILLGVQDDKASILMPESAGGDIWVSKNILIENIFGRFNVTTIKKNGEIVGKFVYNIESNIETEFIYDSIEKKFIEVEEEEEKKKEVA